MKTRKLTLKAERLAELTRDELSLVAAGGDSLVKCVSDRVCDPSDLFVHTGCPGCMTGGYCSGAC